MSAVHGALLLARREIAALMAPADWLEAVETGFRAAAEGRAEAPPPMHIAGEGGAFHAKGARLDHGRGYVALKLNGNFPDNPARGLPTIQGALLLCDAADGRLLALLDSIEVTLRRTAAATALAARFLARSESSTILVVGCGAQATAQLDALREVLPLRRAFLFDRDRPKARDLAARVAGLEASATGDLPGAAAQSDVIVGCTTARTPWLAADMVRPGTFVAAVGADSPDKNEVRPELMARARVVTDVTDQCAVMGELHHALRAEAMRCDEVHAELGELVSGARPGRIDGDAITLFDSTGTALQDVAAAALIFERATVRGGVPAIDLATA